MMADDVKVFVRGKMKLNETKKLSKSLSIEIEKTRKRLQRLEMRKQKLELKEQYQMEKTKRLERQNTI